MPANRTNPTTPDPKSLTRHDLRHLQSYGLQIAVLVPDGGFT